MPTPISRSFLTASQTPGVGKTLTAESVAEHMRVPLYMLSASDLGTHSTEVETSLTTILEMVAKWNAVLLLDAMSSLKPAQPTTWRETSWYPFSYAHLNITKASCSSRQIVLTTWTQLSRAEFTFPWSIQH
jgi:SpoVK/Ycf46/Vps4 family AAA+-type ATPase